MPYFFPLKRADGTTSLLHTHNIQDVKGQQGVFRARESATHPGKTKTKVLRLESVARSLIGEKKPRRLPIDGPGPRVPPGNQEEQLAGETRFSDGF